MFERFTPEARRVIVRAQEMSRGFGHNYIGTEHVLLGVLDAEGSIARAILDGMGVDEGVIRTAVLAEITPGEGEVGAHIPFTPRAKSALEGALRASVQLGTSHIGPEHLLLGLTMETAGIAGHVLDSRGVTEANVRGAIQNVLGATGTDGPIPLHEERPAGPLCPDCDMPLEDTLVTKVIETPRDREPIRDRVTVVYCEACGHTLETRLDRE